MPIFEYECKSCGSVTEFLVKSPAAMPALACKECGSKKLRKLFSPISIAVRDSSACVRDRGYEGPSCEGACPSGECRFKK